MNRPHYDIIPERETGFPSEKPTEPNPHIPEHKPQRLREAPTEPDPQIPEWEPTRTINPDPHAPEDLI